MSALNVGYPIAVAVTHINIEQFTQQKGLMSTVTVGKVLSVTINSIVISWFTQENGLMAAVTLGSLSCISNFCYYENLHCRNAR